MKAKQVKLHDEYNTIIFIYPEDDEEKVKALYEAKLKQVYTLRQDSPNSFNQTPIAESPYETE